MLGQSKIRIPLLLWMFLIITIYSCGKKETSKESEALFSVIEARNLGLAYLEENRLDEAEAQFIKMIENAPDDAMGHANLGLIYLRKSDFTKAEKAVQQALRLSSEDSDINLILAEVYDAIERDEEAIEILQKSLSTSPGHLRSIYKIIDIYSKMAYARPEDQAVTANREDSLLELVKLAPGNIPVRLQLIESLLTHGETGSALTHLEVLIQQIPEPPKEASRAIRETLKQMQIGNNSMASRFFKIVHNVLKVTPRYQSGLWYLKGPGGAVTGFPILDFSENLEQQMEDQSAVLNTLRFTDASSTAGLYRINSIVEGSTSSVLAVGDFDGDKSQDIYYSVYNEDQNHVFLMKHDFGELRDVAAEEGVSHNGRDLHAIFADIDNNGHLELVVTNSTGARYYNNGGEGQFSDLSSESGLGALIRGNRILPGDFDHEGDLDIYIINNGPNLFFRNNLNGSFSEMAKVMKIDGGNASGRDAAFGDFDDDGDLDIVVINTNNENKLFSNLRQGQFEDITQVSGLGGEKNNTSVVGGDYNNDGRIDLFMTGESGTGGLFRNAGEGTFEQVETKILETGSDAAFLDFDNDGYLDLVIASVGGVRLFHSERGKHFEEMSHLLPEETVGARQVEVMDYNMDGDLDILLVGTDGKLHLLRNDGGNVNKYLKVRLVGLRLGSGKNNHFGIGAKVEVRAGDLYQSRTVTEEVIHFGLGQRLKADVMRIIWTNGAPQNLFFPGSDQDIVEEQMLKGSCPFLYAWDGERFEFVKDILWRSALGMPMGIMAGELAYAFANSSEEYMKIPGDALVPKDGDYTLQITVELWETSYYDELKLRVVDHPAEAEIYVDEKFITPPYPPDRIYSVSDRRKPLSAVDGEGNDLMALLDEWDYKYVSNLMPTQFQGITEPHDMIIDLGDLSNAEEVILFLHGWIFPTDASINVNVSQTPDVTVFPPRVQVPDENGEWTTVIESINFPNGKDKTCIVDLSGKFLTDDYRVRLQTSMQIYWDHLFFTVDEPAVDIAETVLSPSSADLHYRGYSRMYRKGGRYGPHWFDYSTVETGPKWRDLTGDYTRYGEVLALVTEPDNEVVIMNAGDEMTVKFSNSDVPPLQKGWVRDYILYSDGWLKDGDMNTARGQTVAPLPFHALKAYPYGPEQKTPDEGTYREYLMKYNTRRVTGDVFLEQLSAPRPNK